jgi:hypothetical protein
MSITITFHSSALPWATRGVHHDHFPHSSTVLIEYTCPSLSPSSALSWSSTCVHHDHLPVLSTDLIHFRCPPRSPFSSQHYPDQVQVSTTITLLPSALSWSSTGVHHDHLSHLNTIVITCRCAPRSPSSPHDYPKQVPITVPIHTVPSATCALLYTVPSTHEPLRTEYSH